MALKLEDKKAIVAEVAKVAASASSAVAADYRGLTVAAMTDLRNKARASGIYLRVIRNTLSKRALEGTAFACLADVLEGQLFLAFSTQDPVAAAKLLHEIAKEHEKLKVKALVIGGQLFGPEKLEMVAKLPTKEQALAMLLSLLQASVTRLARTLAEPCAQLARAVAQIRDQKQA